MTATRVNGLAVLADEPAEAPLSTAEKPVFFKQIRRLLLEDATEVYGCVHCDYTGPNAMKIRAHLGKHTGPEDRRRGPRPKADSNSPSSDPSQITLAEVLDQARSLKEARETAERWKDRALRAERDLATIRQALSNRR